MPSDEIWDSFTKINDILDKFALVTTECGHTIWPTHECDPMPAQIITNNAMSSVRRFWSTLHCGCMCLRSRTLRWDRVQVMSI